MKKGLLCFLLCLVVLVVSVGGTLMSAHANSYVPTIQAGPNGGETISLLEGNIYTVVKNYTPCITENYFFGTDQYAPKSVDISWDCKQQSQYYILKLADNARLVNAQEYVTFDTAVTVDALYTGKQYYYQVVAVYEQKTVKSRIFDFKTEATPRTISIEGVSNTRDIGGYYTVDGKYRVKQGMAYRGANADGITEVGKQKLLNVYGIKTDLDIRGTSASPLGDGVNFISANGPYYAGSATTISPTGIDTTNEEYREALRTEIRTFANPANYPIYFHCAIGRDRTGTLAFLINALLGVSKDDLYMDYELSFLSASADTGLQPSYFMNDPFKQLYEYIDSYKEEGTLAEKTEQYMLDLGITAEEIAAIRQIMLEEVA